MARLLGAVLVLGLSCAAIDPDCKNHILSHDSFVCVCTEAQPCDPIVGPTKTSAGVVTRWQSSRDGARLRKQTLHFGNGTNQGKKFYL